MYIAILNYIISIYNKIYKIKVLIAIFLVLVFSGCSNYENAKNIKKYQTTDISPEQIASDGINFILKKMPS